MYLLNALREANLLGVMMLSPWQGRGDAVACQEALRSLWDSSRAPGRGRDQPFSWCLRAGVPKSSATSSWQLLKHWNKKHPQHCMLLGYLNFCSLQHRRCRTKSRGKDSAETPPSSSPSPPAKSYWPLTGGAHLYLECSISLPAILVRTYMHPTGCASEGQATCVRKQFFVD